MRLVELRVAPDATVEQALRASGLLETCPEIDLRVHRVGIFNEECALDDRVSEGDRIEVYRPLRVDPKEARRRRAAAQRAKPRA